MILMFNMLYILQNLHYQYQSIKCMMFRLKLNQIYKLSILKQSIHYKNLSIQYKLTLLSDNLIYTQCMHLLMYKSYIH